MTERQTTKIACSDAETARKSPTITLGAPKNATPDTISRRFISTSGQISITPDEIVCRLNSRTYSPVMRSADLPQTKIPWWNDRSLRFEFA